MRDRESGLSVSLGERLAHMKVEVRAEDLPSARPRDGTVPSVDQTQDRPDLARLSQVVRYEPPAARSSKVDGRYRPAAPDEVRPRRIVEAPSGARRHVPGPAVQRPAKGLPDRDGLACSVAFHGGASLTVPRMWGSGFDALYLRSARAEFRPVRSVIRDGKALGGGYEIRVPSRAEKLDRDERDRLRALRVLPRKIREEMTKATTAEIVARAAEINAETAVKAARAADGGYHGCKAFLPTAPMRESTASVAKVPDPFAKPIDRGRSVKDRMKVSETEAYRTSKEERVLAEARARARVVGPVFCDARNAPVRNIIAF